MSKREAVEMLHELEQLSVLILVEGDEAIAEAIDEVLPEEQQ